MRFSTSPDIASGTATAGVATATHTGVAAKAWRPAWVVASFATLTQTGTLSIQDAADTPVVLFSVSFTGEFAFNFGEHMPRATTAKNLTATLTAGAAGVVGTVRLAAYKGQ